MPPSIMIILVVYCLQYIEITAFPYGMAELISVVLTAFLRFWKNNTVLSILLGTDCCMILVRSAFPM